MDLGIKDKVALVTASSRGLGKAIATTFCREGAKVVMCSRNQARIDEARALVASETGGLVLAFKADVTNQNEIQALVDFATEKLGTIDILVCNAGGPKSGFVFDFKPDDYQQALELNLLSTIRLCYAVIPFMKKNSWGRIITLTSVSAKQPIDNLILSNTARAGVLGFTKSLANQLACFNITVNSLCPGYTKTERIVELAEAFVLAGKGSQQDFYSQLEKLVPLGRLGQPEELAAAAAFLASRPAGYITGSALAVDGGYIRGLF